MAERLIRLGLIVFSLWMGVGAAWAAEPSGPVRIVGNGPEQPMIEELARAFERKYRLAYVDIFWHEFAKTLKMLRAGETDIAVTGKPEDDLQATRIGWDGIAIMVHISNTAKELTKQQIADIFAGKV
ncbi:MAG: substrate-binding domain-containing protein, partial [Nitrospirales bacterium]